MTKTSQKTLRHSTETSGSSKRKKTSADTEERNAIHAAGLAVNRFDLTSAAKIREAVALASDAAPAVKSRSEGTKGKTGDFTGMPIAIFQNWLYEQNREWRFTDGTLAVLWCLEFPNARCDYADRHRYVASTRTEYNAGRHQAPPPGNPSVAYSRDGQPVIGTVTTSLSIRLTDRERKLVATAAKLRDESPTRFIKSSAITRAAHVVNISKKTTLDFGALADRVATLLFTKEFDQEFRTKYLTGSNHPVRSDEILTLGDLDDENEEWINNAAFGDIPETWMGIDTSTHQVAKMTPGGDEHFVQEYVCPTTPIVRDDRVPMTRDGFRELENAVRLGGTEFLQRILEIGRTSYFREEDLDEPIDPETID